MDARNESKPTTMMNRTSDRELVMTRMFNGPPRIVFDAWTKPELVRRWWAPASRGVTIKICDAEVRVGGSYRYVLNHHSGEVGFSGKYTEVTPHSRLVYTQIFEQMADAGAVIVTITFDEQDGKTKLVSHELYPSKEALDGAVSSGMEAGALEAMEQLDELIASL